MLVKPVEDAPARDPSPRSALAELQRRLGLLRCQGGRRLQERLVGASPQDEHYPHSACAVPDRSLQRRRVLAKEPTSGRTGSPSGW